MNRLRKSLPWVLGTLAALLGWGLLTWSLIWATGLLWILPFSGGILLLGLAGWRWVWEVLYVGLLTASLEEEAPTGEADQHTPSPQPWE